MKKTFYLLRILLLLLFFLNFHVFLSSCQVEALEKGDVAEEIKVESTIYGNKQDIADNDNKESDVILKNNDKIENDITAAFLDSAKELLKQIDVDSKIKEINVKKNKKQLKDGDEDKEKGGEKIDFNDIVSMALKEANQFIRIKVKKENKRLTTTGDAVNSKDNNYEKIDKITEEIDNKEINGHVGIQTGSDGGGIREGENPALCDHANLFMSKYAEEHYRYVIPSVQLEDKVLSATLTERSGCGVLFEGWWWYEFCFGRYIRQFHIEKGVIVSENFLGFGYAALEQSELTDSLLLYASGFSSVSNQIKKENLSPVELKKQEYHEYSCVNNNINIDPSLGELFISPSSTVIKANYLSGTICPGNSKPRETTVFFICDNSNEAIQKSYLPFFFDVKEISMCKYRVRAYGTAVCALMGLSTTPMTKISAKPLRVFPYPNAPNEEHQHQQAFSVGGEAEQRQHPSQTGKYYYGGGVTSDKKLNDKKITIKIKNIFVDGNDLERLFESKNEPFPPSTLQDHLIFSI